MEYLWKCGLFSNHEHNKPRVVLYKLWHDMINSHKVTKHACTSSWLPLAHSKHHTYHQVTVMNKQKKKQRLQTTHIYIHISCKCDTNRAGHFTLDAHASRPVACLYIYSRRYLIYHSFEDKLSTFRDDSFTCNDVETCFNSWAELRFHNVYVITIDKHNGIIYRYSSKQHIRDTGRIIHTYQK